jgi:multicomponent Na+:H+ antiporter subunit B
MSLSATGLLLAAFSGLPSFFASVPFLTGLWVTPVVFGVEIPLSTPLVFDIGVYLVVVGSIGSIGLALEERERN